MNEVDSSHDMIPAAPIPHEQWPRFRRMLRLLQDSVIAVWPEAAYEKEFIDRSRPFFPLFIASNPEAVKHVLATNASNYVKTVAARRQLRPALGDGMITAEGETWRRHRRVAQGAFRAQKLEALVPAMTGIAEESCLRWQALGDGATVDAAEEMTRLALRIIARTMFSTDVDEDTERILGETSHYQETLGRLGLFDLLQVPEWATPWRHWKARRLLWNFDHTIARLIAKRREEAGSQSVDLLSMLLEARDEETGGRLKDAEVRDEVATILAAGNETTANALAFCWYLLSIHPWAEEKLHAELAEVLGGRAPTAADLPQLRYTRMVIDETMRLYPPVHTLERKALAADEIIGHRIPKGAIVVVSPWLIHRHRKLWDEPELFDPERFAPERATKPHRFSYIPFGGGPRTCLGASFAMTEALAVVATIAQHYRLRLKPGYKVEPVARITLRPRGGLPMLIEKRARSQRPVKARHDPASSAHRF